MLLTTPIEVQTEICQYLPRRDLASLLRTCSSLCAVAVRVLYAHVKLHSVGRIEAFFFSPPNLRQGAVTVAQHHVLKRSQWDGIKTVDIKITAKRGLRSSPLPPSLLGTDPLRLDRVRLTWSGNAGPASRFLVPILQAFSPSKVGIHRAQGGNAGIEDLIAATGWKDVTDLTFIGRRHVPSSFSGTRAIHHPFAQVKTVHLVLFWVTQGWATFEDDIGLLLRLRPALEAIKIVVNYKADQLGSEIDLRHGLKGKPASFFSVARVTKGADRWGDIDAWEK